jgi:type II secretory pathway component GspD/PulD (secretin)
MLARQLVKLTFLKCVAMNQPTRRTAVASLATILFGLSLMLLAGASRAEAIAATNPLISVNARDQSLTAFLNELLGAAGYSTVISSAVDGRVSGRFDGRLDTVLGDLARKQAITFYRTGKIIYVYRTGEIGARILSTKPAQADRLTRVARKLGMFDSNNFLARAENGTVVAVGTPRFLDQLDELAQADKSELATARAATPGNLISANVQRQARKLADSSRIAQAERLASSDRVAKPRTVAKASATGIAAKTRVGPTLGPQPVSIVTIDNSGIKPTSPAGQPLTAESANSFANSSNPLSTALPELTPFVLDVPASTGSANSSLQAQNTATDRTPLRPRIVWRSAYAPPEKADIATR